MPGAAKPKRRQRNHPFRSAVLRGLGVVMPPLLTILLFIWAWATIEKYLLRQGESLVTWCFVQFDFDDIQEIPEDVDPDKVKVSKNGETMTVSAMFGGARTLPKDIASKVRLQNAEFISFQTDDGRVFVQVNGESWIREDYLALVRKDPGQLSLAAATPEDIYKRYVKIKHLPRWRVVPIFLLLFVMLLYLLGKFLAAGVGRIFWNGFESLIRRLPVIRNVYSSVKQITDFIFTERDVEYTRVVAVQYPREGIWSVGFVTGESMLDIRSTANEAVLSVLMPTSPMPATGFTITVRKSETVDLNITVDQAIQFIVSCGVVVPPQQVKQGRLDVTEEQQEDDTPETSESGNGEPAKSEPAGESSPTGTEDVSE